MDKNIYNWLAYMYFDSDNEKEDLLIEFTATLNSLATFLLATSDVEKIIITDYDEYPEVIIKKGQIEKCYNKRFLKDIEEGLKTNNEEDLLEEINITDVYCNKARLDSEIEGFIENIFDIKLEDKK